MGNPICDYFKKVPFEYGKYREYLDRLCNKEFTILEIDGVGRIGIGICKDITNAEVKLFHKHIGTNLLIIPAYSGSMDLKPAAEELSMEYNCIVAVANACSALNHKNQADQRIGFLSLPAKKGTDRDVFTKEYCKNECVDECSCKCIGKMFIVDFCHTQNDGGKLNYVLEETVF